MPDLEPCSMCGRQVLISRYSWSKSLVICKLCEELNIQPPFLKEPNQEVNSSVKVELPDQPDLLKARSRIASPTRSEKVHEEILVTWDSLLKISLAGLLLLTLSIIGFLNMDDKKYPSKNIPLGEINSVEN